MWWPDRAIVEGRGRARTPWLLLRLSSVVLLAALTAGCFEPLYGQRSFTGGSGMRERLSAVNVKQIKAPSGTPESRLAVEVRNVLLFELTGGAGTSSPTHELTIELSTLRQALIVDITTSRPDVEQLGINASYTLVELATGKSVVNSQTFARVTFDNPGQAQRFSRSRGQRDAEDRAAKLIAENIRSRLASYFAAGT
jgi:LPS-assembly lipoprotein